MREEEEEETVSDLSGGDGNNSVCNAAAAAFVGALGGGGEQKILCRHVINRPPGQQQWAPHSRGGMIPCLDSDSDSTKFQRGYSWFHRPTLY